MIERGLNHRIWTAYEMETTLKCLDQRGPEIKTLDLNEFRPAYKILLVGKLITLIIFLMEILRRRSLSKLFNVITNQC